MRRIKPHELSGVFDQKIKFNARLKFENLVEEQMRAAGSVPVVDMNTQWFTGWDEENQRYTFTLVMYGVFVGKKKAREEVFGWSQEEGKLVLF